MENKHGLDLTQGSVKSLLLRFAMPFFLSGIVSALYGLADMFVIGKYCAEEVIAGVGTGTLVMSIVYTATVSIGTGGAVLIGRKFGERDAKGCAKASGTFMTIGLILAVLITAFIWFMRKPLLDIMQTPVEAYPSALRYIEFSTIGLPFLFGFNIISSIARGLGNSRAPSIAGAVGCIVHIIMDFLFAGLFRWEEFGVAVATSIAQFLTFAMLGLWLLKVKFPFPFTKRDFVMEKQSFFAVFRVGMPLWAQELLVHISFMIITGIVNTMGVVASASVSIISRVFNIGALVPLAVGNAIAAMTAQNFGANKRDRAYASLRWGIVYTVAIEAALLIWWQITPESITSLFANADAVEVIAGAAAYLRAFSIDLVMIAFIFCCNAYLSGCGKSGVSMIHSIVATFAVRIPLSILFAKLADIALNDRLYLLGLASPVASAVSIVICLFYIRWYNKRHLLPDVSEVRV